MTLDKLSKGSLAVGEMELNGVGRRRMRLRRIRPISRCGDSDILSDYDGCNKKRRSVKLMKNETYGLTSVIGRRREMEDAATAELGFLRKGGRSYDFFGVYDGHGGCRVAEACRDKLHKFVVEGNDDDNVVVVMDWEKVMAAAFEKMDEEVSRGDAQMATMGSTAVVAVVGDEEMVVANCGDSRAVMSRGGVAVQLSDDHKPDRPDELERIENSGGKVINWNGLRVLGVLATSRSIGDEFLKPYVISEPEVKILSRTKSDEFLILASDGLWDVVSNDVACQVARRCLYGKLRLSNLKLSEVGENDDNSSSGRRSRASEAAAILTELAIGRGSSDNVSVIVVELNRSSK